MNIEEKKDTVKEVEQKDSPASIPPQPEKTFSSEEVSNIVKTAVQEAIKNYRVPEDRKEINDNIEKMAKAIAESQAQLIQPQQMPSEKNGKLDLVNNILNEYWEKKKTDSLGKVLYPNNEEGLFKSKIVLMKKLGLSNEEIADIL